MDYWGGGGGAKGMAPPPPSSYAYVYIREEWLGRSSYTGYFGVVVALFFYVHGKHLRSCRDGQLT